MKRTAAALFAVHELPALTNLHPGGAHTPASKYSTPSMRLQETWPPHLTWHASTLATPSHDDALRAGGVRAPGLNVERRCASTNGPTPCGWICPVRANVSMCGSPWLAHAIDLGDAQRGFGRTVGRGKGARVVVAVVVVVAADVVVVVELRVNNDVVVEEPAARLVVVGTALVDVVDEPEALVVVVEEPVARLVVVAAAAVVVVDEPAARLVVVAPLCVLVVEPAARPVVVLATALAVVVVPVIGVSSSASHHM